MACQHNHPDHDGLSRRNLMTLTAGLGVVAAAGLSMNARPAMAASGPTTTLKPDQALAALKEGNARYLAMPHACVVDMAKGREHVAQSQAPWATIVGCADSRVPPELLFGGLGFGELFVARNAGNLVDTATMGTIEYGAAVLGVPLIVVLGHERCGAIAAACDVVTKGANFPGSIGPMIEPIIPAALTVRSQQGDFVNNTVIASAKRTASRLSASGPILADLVKAGKLKIVAARYDLDDGKVEFYEVIKAAVPAPQASGTPPSSATVASPSP